LLDSIPRQDAPQTRRILFASLIGTTIEFFDFYIYATAAVLVFPRLFFPKGDPATAMLQSLATFALAFFARPIGSALFGHFGDRIGRKATLVTALLTMGISTVCIGLLPTYASIGVLAAGLLALCRLGQGVGLGGEWGGAVLLATENAPPGKQAWYGSFPQLGAPLGFLCSTGVFLLMSNNLNEAQLFSWGWRVPFLASAVLVLVGLYVRLQLVETPAFKRSVAQGERVRVPFMVVFAKYPRELVLGTLGATTTFVVFYLMTVFALGWATSALGFGRHGRGAVLRIDHTVLRNHRRSHRRAGDADDCDGFDHRLRLRFPAPVFRPRYAERAGVFDARFCLERFYLWPAGQRTCQLVSDRGALHRHLAHLQSRRNTGRLARALDRDFAGFALRRGLCRVLSVGGWARHFDRIVPDQTRERRRAATGELTGELR